MSILPRVALSRRGLPGDPVAALTPHADVVEWAHERPPNPAELRDLAADCDAVLCWLGDRIDADLFAAAPRLRVAALASAGYDGVDLAAVRAAGVVVSHVPGILQETTADLAFALILMARRRLGAAVDAMRAGGWTDNRMDGFLGLDVHGATLGIVGFGQIGQAVARRARGFGMRVHHHGGRSDGEGLSQRVTLDELLRTSDVVSLHLPLTDATRGLIGAAELALMKPTATLVNTARGGIVDEAALADALRAGRLHSAGLDVMTDEPRRDPADPLFGVPNLVVLPHVGSATEATRAAMVDLAVRNVLEVLAGRPALTPVPGTRPVPG
ncbi:D-glycerate dehydrogenase [Luedemannella helvata]